MLPPHSLHHTFAKYCVRKGTTPASVRAVLGYENLGAASLNVGLARAKVKGVTGERALSQSQQPSPAELQTSLIKLLKSSKVDRRLGKGEFYLAEQLTQVFPAHEQPDQRQIMEAVWSLISQGLAYIDYSQSSADNWKLHLTRAGEATANDQSINPDSPGEYLQRLQEDVPEASDTVHRYLNEALSSYTNRCYLASAVMLGVASEAAFHEMAVSFGQWLPSKEGEKLLSLIAKRNVAYLAKFEAFRKKLEPRKPDIPAELSDGMALTLDSILDLLRIYRNEAGHPWGKQIDRAQARINLEMFVRYLQRMCAFKAFFDSDPKLQDPVFEESKTSAG
jgi:hypothetical protein